LPSCRCTSQQLGGVLVQQPSSAIVLPDRRHAGLHQHLVDCDPRYAVVQRVEDVDQGRAQRQLAILWPAIW